MLVLNMLANHLHELTLCLMKEEEPGKSAKPTQFLWKQIHIDQNEKLVLFGVTHVCAVDGYSGMIVGFATFPVKNNALVYEHLNKRVIHACIVVIFTFRLTRYELYNSTVLAKLVNWVCLGSSLGEKVPSLCSAIMVSFFCIMCLTETSLWVRNDLSN